MNKSQEQAVAKLNSLKTEFDAVVKNPPESFFVKWVGTYDVSVGPEAAGFASLTKMAANKIEQDTNKTAVVWLTNLKKVLDDRAAECKTSSQKFSISSKKKERRKNEVQRYSGYSQKVADVLKLL